MIAILKKRLIVLSMPKCATTSIESALEPHAEILFRNPPGLKHTTYRSFMRNIAPMLKSHGYPREELKIVCLMREPAEWLHSWWRYRSRKQLEAPRHPNHKNYTGHMTFEDFLDAYVSENQPPFAQVGNQRAFISDKYGRIGPNFVFRYEENKWKDFLRQAVQDDLHFPNVNISPKTPSVKSGSLRNILYDQYEVYDQLELDGHAPNLVENSPARIGVRQ